MDTATEARAMVTNLPETTHILLVEDNLADADVIREHLTESPDQLRASGRKGSSTTM